MTSGSEIIIQIIETQDGKFKCFVPPLKIWVTSNTQEQLKRIVIKLLNK